MNANDYATMQQYTLDVLNGFGDLFTTVSMSSATSDKSKLTYCYQAINDSKAWLSLWFSVAQFGLFHFVMFTMSRIFFIGL